MYPNVPFLHFSDYKVHQTDTTVKFVVTMADGELRKAEGSCDLYKKFYLTSKIKTNNMVS